MFEIVPCVIHVTDLSRKFDKNPFFCFSILMLLTDTDNTDENPVSKCKKPTIFQIQEAHNISEFSFYHVREMLKISWKSLHAFSHYVGNRLTDKATMMKS